MQAVPVRVLVVGGSVQGRRRLAEILRLDRRIALVGAAVTLEGVRNELRRKAPDVVVLSDDQRAGICEVMVRAILQWRPMPVVVIAAGSEGRSDAVTRELDARAVVRFEMPAGTAGNSRAARQIVRGIIHAVGPGRNIGGEDAAVVPEPDAFAVMDEERRAPARATLPSAMPLIAIGASTGGTEAIKAVLAKLPRKMPGIVITQHIPELFSMLFARRMNSCSRLHVREARDGEPVRPGHVHIAPGDRHLLIERSGGGYVCRLNRASPVNGHRPSVDVMFLSVAKAAGAHAIGVLLTGMGRDGAEGLLQLRRDGAATLVQDQATSVVWGMPGEAMKRGAAEAAIPLGDIADRLVRLSCQCTMQRAGGVAR